MSVSTITKSIRLTPAEAEELTEVARRAAASESALVKKWILEGIQSLKLERAIRAYMERETDLRGGAAMAGVSYNRFMHEIQKRHIIILEDDHFLDRMAGLADAFDSEPLRQAIEQVVSAPG
jgi:predicted HTH domain antitoxin